MVSGRYGQWGLAVKISVPAALLALSPSIGTISCASPRNCAAGGSYETIPGEGNTVYYQAFVVSEVGGRWGQALEVPGTAALNSGGQDAINSLSCRSPGSCAAAGDYADRSGHAQVFVVSEN